LFNLVLCVPILLFFLVNFRFFSSQKIHKSEGKKRAKGKKEDKKVRMNCSSEGFGRRTSEGRPNIHIGEIGETDTRSER